jgi:hypothetical protein
MTTFDEVITIKDAAKDAGVTTEQIRRLIKRGTLEIPEFAQTWQRKPILRKSFEEWLANRKPAGAPKKAVVKLNGEYFKRLDPAEVPKG